jgi:hypothetical protein
MDVRFDIVATFPTSGTVFLPPTMTSHLLETHRKYYIDLANYIRLIITTDGICPMVGIRIVP